MSVYFIRCGEDGPVKIGIASDVEARRTALQTAHFEELHVLRSVDGTHRHERWLHDRYAANHIRGEWFRFDPEMLSVELPDTATIYKNHYARAYHPVSTEAARMRSMLERIALPIAPGETITAQQHRIAERMGVPLRRALYWWKQRGQSVGYRDFYGALLTLHRLDEEDGLGRMTDDERQQIRDIERLNELMRKPPSRPTPEESARLMEYAVERAQRGHGE